VCVKRLPSVPHENILCVKKGCQAHRITKMSGSGEILSGLKDLLWKVSAFLECCMVVLISNIVESSFD
jgi:hypothetical protein